MRNDVSSEKTRAFKSKLKLFYEKFFYFVSIALGSLHFDILVFLLNYHRISGKTTGARSAIKR